jgi:MFS family permease
VLKLNPADSVAGPPWALAWRLAFGQLVAWGVLYYAFTVVIGPMQAATGWSRAFLNAGVSIGLLVWGLCAYPAGVWIHRHGARGLMTAASAAGGLALALIGLTTTPAGYLAAWALLGAAMAGVLYEPAFAVVTERFGPRFRQGITIVTLVGGLASTAFIPAAQGMVAWFGWQHALIGLGLFQAAVGTAVHWFGIPTRPPQPTEKRETVPVIRSLLGSGSLPEWRDQRFAGLALWFAAHAATFSGTMMLLVPVIQQSGLSNEAMLGAMMLIGPMQVAGRLALMKWNGRHSSLELARGATLLLVASLVLLTFFRPTFGVLAGFAVLYGTANGVMTILRGTSVAELFGRERYALLGGALALPSVLAKSAAPWVLATLWEGTGAYQAAFGGALVFASAGVVGLHLAAKPRLPCARPQTFAERCER